MVKCTLYPRCFQSLVNESCYAKIRRPFSELSENDLLDNHRNGFNLLLWLTILSGWNKQRRAFWNTVLSALSFSIWRMQTAFHLSVAHSDNPKAPLLRPSPHPLFPPSPGLFRAGASEGVPHHPSVWTSLSSGAFDRCFKHRFERGEKQKSVMQDEEREMICRLIIFWMWVVSPQTHSD